MSFKSGVALEAVEWGEWSYAPAVGVGPLLFGMTFAQVIEAAGGLGLTKVSDCPQHCPIFAPTWKVDVCWRTAATSPSGVTLYVSQAAGLFCVAADAMHGPQVVHDGVPLVGRDLSELEGDVIAYAEATDTFVRYTPEGYPGPDDPGIVMRAQRVGQVLRSRPLFMVTRDGANTEWDSVPAEEHCLNGAPLPDAP